MELKRCQYGHSYDPSITPECPECAALAGHTIPLNREPDSISATEPFLPDSCGITRKQTDGTVDVNNPGRNWAQEDSYQSGGYAPEAYSPSLPKDYKQREQSGRPVTGWLVCVEGAQKGQDYRLHDEMNYVGRGAANDVVLSADPTVSRDRHALIAYDSRDRMFYFAPANGASLVRQNGKPVLTTAELKAGDRLEIGSGIYLFVPLCGPDFQW